MVDHSASGKVLQIVVVTPERAVQRTLQRYKDLADVIAILGIEELSEDDKLTVSRARKMQRFLSQPMRVAEVFTGKPGVYVPLRDTVAGFKAIMDGEVDDIPETFFFQQGTLESVKREYAAAQK